MLSGRTKLCAVLLDERTQSDAERLGGGNKSAGVRKAFSILRARPETVASVADEELIEEGVRSASLPPWIHHAPKVEEPAFMGQKRTIYLGADVWLMIKDLGNGNFSAGVKKAIVLATHCVSHHSSDQ